MLNKIKNRKQEGFTIIEVLIVLAIAGLIMLIVFLAVPALQRSSRNRGREADASLVATAVNACITNNNGDIKNCGPTNSTGISIDAAKMNQLTGTNAYSANGTGSGTSANWHFGNTCNGALGNGTGTARDFVVLFQVETATGTAARCLQS